MNLTTASRNLSSTVVREYFGSNRESRDYLSSTSAYNFTISRLYYFMHFVIREKNIIQTNLNTLKIYFYMIKECAAKAHAKRDDNKIHNSIIQKSAAKSSFTLGVAVGPEHSLANSLSIMLLHLLQSGEAVLGQHHHPC